MSATIFLNTSFITTDRATAAPDTPNIPNKVLITINPISPLTSIRGFNKFARVSKAPVSVITDGTKGKTF